MHPIFDKIQKQILKEPSSELLRHVCASNMPSSYYGEEELRSIWSLAPYSDIYYSVLNPIFSKIFLQMGPKNEEYPLVLLRDGALDLFDFFKKYPDPKVFDQQFILHHSLSKILNRKWRENAIFYELFSIDESRYCIEKKRSKLLVSTLINDAFFTREQIISSLKKAHEFAVSKGLKVELHLPIRENLYFKSDYKNLSPAFDLSLCALDILGDDISIISDKDLSKNSDFREYYFYLAPDDKFCISDNQLEHYLLANGASSMNEYQNFNSFSINLSSRHGAKLFDHKSLPASVDLAQFDQDADNLLCSKEVTKEQFNNLRLQFLKL